MSVMADTHPSHPGSDKPLILAIAALLVLYAAAVVLHLPPVFSSHVDTAMEHAGELAAEDAAEGHAEGGHAAAPPLWMVTPFVCLLGCIAVLPLVPSLEHWWENNLHRFYVAGVLGLATLGYYLSAGGMTDVSHVLEHALLGEYVPFIVLLFSLYTISGGIRIECDLRAHPRVNSAFILVGGLLASFIGTTGAAMLLIRPLLETNSERRHVRHTVIFFIFVVCNCGGLLLPIGDPPLFLGYLAGVNFWWTLQLWPEWLFVNGSLIAIYFLWDRLFSYPKETLEAIRQDETRVRPLRATGWKLNGLLLLGVVASVALLAPDKPIPGTSFTAWPFLREAVQIGLVGVSLFLGSKEVREKNRFNYHAILEVAALFFGIFICMQPALAILDAKGASLGVDSPQKFFWFTGGLSSVLDNAPTYVVFFTTAKSVPASGMEMLALEGGKGQIPVSFLVAISLGAVLMGSMTYIGNGPNFMVKAIAEKSGIRMPSFFGFMLYSIGVLLPVLVVTTLIFL